MRAFAKASPDAYYAESFKDWHVTEGVTPEQWKVRRQQGLWQAEMYGYIFGAARAGVSHIVRRDTMLYPGYAPTGGSLPTILHYGADYALDRLPNTPKGSFQQGGSGGSGGDGGDGRGGGGGTTCAATGGVMPPDLYFNKMNYVNLDVYAYLHRACRRPSSSTGGVTAPSDTSPLPCAARAAGPHAGAHTLLFRDSAASAPCRRDRALAARPAGHSERAASQQRPVRVLRRPMRRRGPLRWLECLPRVPGGPRGDRRGVTRVS